MVFISSCLAGGQTLKILFSDINYNQYLIWNNKYIRIDNKPIFYEKYADCGTVYLNDLWFRLDNLRSFEYLKDTGLVSNFLTWSALRLSVPKNKLSSFPKVKFDPMTFKCKSIEFDAY